ncbi:MAG: YcxB family protein [Lachnospiraceae bacterium]|nr:YcxB family protein [Lachnospiraceae bacterium]
MEEHAIDNREEFLHEEGEVHLVGPMRFRDLFAFRLKYSYFGLNGLAYWILTALVLVCLIGYWNSYDVKTRVLLFVILGIMLIYIPGSTALRTLQYTTQMKANGIVMEYFINSNGIQIIQKIENPLLPADASDGQAPMEQSEIIPWEMVRKTKETRRRFFLYVMRNSAFVFAKDLLGEQTDALRKFIEDGQKQKAAEV